MNRVYLHGVAHVKKQGGTLFIASEGEGVVDEKSVVATGSDTPRTLSDRFGDVVNVRDFGAVGDGEHDDTEAWNAWQAALEKGGIGYVPSGAYLINGVIRYFVSGCIGNGIDHIFSDNPYNDGAVGNHLGETGPIIEYYKRYNGNKNWTPIVDLSFDSIGTGDYDWNTDGCGNIGLQVRGQISGNGNSMPIGVRSLIHTLQNGDGDAVALWGRVTKRDPEGGTNLSDACGCHCSAYQASQSAGLVMGSEHWAVMQHSSSEQDLGTPDGSAVAIRASCWSPYAMGRAAILIDGASSNYGSWNAIKIARSTFRYDGNISGHEGTVMLHCADWFTDLGYPDVGWWVGKCNWHIKTVGAYSFNIKSDSLIIENNEDSNNTAIRLDNVGDEGSAAFSLYNQGVKVWDVYAENKADAYYRCTRSSSHHVFLVMDDSSQKTALSVGPIAVMPGTDAEIASGWSGHRWSQVYASTSAISTSDERMKQDISDIPDAVFRAWEKVNFQQFKFKDAVKKKGNEARLHSGLIAQRIIEAFKEEGLDASEYGLLCYDEWPAEEAVIERVKVVDREETHNEDGSVKDTEQFHYEENVLSPAREAGNCYSVRYEEALCLEAAYQRRRAQRLEEAVSALETRLAAVETAITISGKYY